MKVFVNVHTHKPSEKHIAIVNQFVHELSMDVEFFSPVSLGIHPWHIQKMKVDEALLVLKQACHHRNVYAIGECGLDRAISINFEKQEEAFLKQNEIAAEHDLPLIIHSVRAYSDFLRLMKEGQNKSSWIFHGFRGNYQIAKKLIDFGAYLSFGASLLKEDAKSIEIIKKIPLQRMLFETDDSNVSIESIYQKAAELRSIALGEFMSHIYQNFKYAFNYGVR